MHHQHVSKGQDPMWAVSPLLEVRKDSIYGINSKENYARKMKSGHS